MSNVTKLSGSEVVFSGDKADLSAFLKKTNEKTSLTLMWLQQKCEGLAQASSDKIFSSALLELVRMSREEKFDTLMQSFNDPFNK